MLFLGCSQLDSKRGSHFLDLGHLMIALEDRRYGILRGEMRFAWVAHGQ